MVDILQASEGKRQRTFVSEDGKNDKSQNDLSEVLTCVDTVNKRLDEITSRYPNGFLLVPRQSRTDLFNQNGCKTFLQDENLPDSDSFTSVHDRHRDTNVPFAMKGKPTKKLVGNDFSTTFSLQNKFVNERNDGAASVEQDTFEMNEQEIRFAKSLSRRKTHTNQDNRISAKFGQTEPPMTCDNTHWTRIPIERPNIPRHLGTWKKQVGAGKKKGFNNFLCLWQQKRGTETPFSQKIKMVDEDYWHHLVRDETVKGFRDSKKKGVDTIICLDTSASMTGQPWNQAIDFVRGFIKCVQRQTDLPEGSCEHMGLVVFGHETKVLQHMTTNHDKILEKLEFLYTDGPTPLLGALHLCMGVRSGSGAGLQASKIQMKPRVLLITDGNLTNGMKIAGPDTISPVEKLTEPAAVVNLVSMLVAADAFQIYPVPCGDEADTEFLQRIADMSKGKVIPHSKWEKTSRFYRNVLTAGKASLVCGQTPDIPEDILGGSGGINSGRVLVKTVINGKTVSVLPASGMSGGAGFGLDASNAWVPAIQQMEGATDEDMEEVKEIVKNNMIKHKCGEDDDHVERSDSLPKLGSRVRRGNDWRWGDQDRNSTGTVVNHCASPYGNWIQVVWDKTPMRIARYRYGADCRFDVDVVDEPRSLEEGELIAVGCIVMRGFDWEWDEQDGGIGNNGVVLHVHPSGNVTVRWSNGKTYPYRYGHDAKFDLTICPTKTGLQQNADGINTRNEAGGTKVETLLENKSRPDLVKIDDGHWSDELDNTERMNLRNIESSVNVDDQYIINTQRPKATSDDSE